MLKLIQTRAEDKQRWWQIKNPMLSCRQHTSERIVIHARWEMAYGMKGLSCLVFQKYMANFFIFCIAQDSVKEIYTDMKWMIQVLVHQKYTFILFTLFHPNSCSSIIVNNAFPCLHHLRHLLTAYCREIWRELHNTNT